MAVGWKNEEVVFRTKFKLPLPLITLAPGKFVLDEGLKHTRLALVSQDFKRCLK